MPESSAIATSPVAAAAARALPSALPLNVSAVSGGSSTSSGRGTTSSGCISGSNSRSLCALRVASTSRIPLPPRQARTAPSASSCARRRRSMPPPTSASISSSEARESGVRSAVACTSTRPPSPVITTFMSTSAVESSE